MTKDHITMPLMSPQVFDLLCAVSFLQKNYLFARRISFNEVEYLFSFCFIPMPLVLYDKILKSTITFCQVKLLSKRHPLHNVSIIFTNFQPPHKSHPPYPAYFGCRCNISLQANLKLLNLYVLFLSVLLQKLRWFITGRRGS